ncbi:MULTISPECIES: hypothetical protein [Planktothrix]|uniref:Uncharacterized protein n=3 Tax=Planktothrix agardhii TaxID=1160 RepID=A0A073CJF7_PLAA1|nr:MULTISPECIES: hypothetical protein [Planktothrix]MCB8783189.1 hypothetical protein [Planktothrix agardhii 1808]MCF3606243.1 hypothetical protein [Planktothrix agardhii 1033]CAD5949342.1 hypothetical protein NO108_02820 [Planktothrix rubescens]BBD56124.1 hypothetical protein NIES204_34460 [Planktothrix agardhii NIES-204]KEI68052.1 hypothetical protein A19Y_3250 [Planktothrix agardhii NIVA-CYA 126/8]
MPSQKAQKIDLNGDYPCPCRRKGRLVPIALTEAFGCDRCQQIFVVDESGYCLEQLATHYPYKQAWHWTGHQWNKASPGLKAHYLPMALGMLLVPLVIWLPLALYSPGPNLVLWAMVAIVLAMLPALMVWLAYRR